MKIRLLSFLGSLLLRTYAQTLRIVIDDRLGLATRPVNSPLLWVFWHNRMLLIPIVYRRMFRNRKGVVLTSASRDGEMLAAFMSRFGFEAARGSSSRRGMRALLELTRWVRQGYDVGITPDGPRGPLYQLGPGVISLARKTGAPIVITTLNYERFWSLKSWDRFMIPKPFSKVTLTLEHQCVIPPELPEADFEERRGEVEVLLNAGRTDTL